MKGSLGVAAPSRSFGSGGRLTARISPGILRRMEHRARAREFVRRLGCVVPPSEWKHGSYYRSPRYANAEHSQKTAARRSRLAFFAT